MSKLLMILHGMFALQKLRNHYSYAQAIQSASLHRRVQ